LVLPYENHIKHSPEIVVHSFSHPGSHPKLRRQMQCWALEWGVGESIWWAFHFLCKALKDDQPYPISVSCIHCRGLDHHWHILTRLQRKMG
jgi:hypothetical protein